MRKRRWVVLSLMLVLALVGGACGDDDDEGTVTPGGLPRPTFAAGTTMARLQQNGKIIVGTKFNQIGSGIVNPNTGELEGFDIEIAKLMAVGIFGGTVEEIDEQDRIEFVETVSGVPEAVIVAGERDMVIATYTISDKRKEQVDFAGPYLIDNQDIMVKADNDSIRTVADLNGKRVCTGQGSTSPAHLASKAPQAEVILFAGYPECGDALRQDRVDAVVTDRGILLGIIDGSGGQFKLAKVPVSDVPLGIGIKKGDDAFREFLNPRLEAIYDSGEWAAAYEDTLGKLGLETPQPPPVNRYPSTGAAPATTTTAAGGGGTGTTTATTGGTTTTTAATTATTAGATATTSG
ncbi:MAG: glutamate ABC transporter substrate-binding protein [Acidimicrobiales bacterium]